ncbi:MAG: prephenate dehydratase, partial [Solirubrobacteraceae bacterium]|nr:prephenate dehydratase [Solirubrobacteraceae bacterium]
MRAAYLGPAGTYSHEALRDDPRAGGWEPVPIPTIHDAVLAVESGAVDRAIVPIENSTEGAVGATLDALAIDTAGVAIVGEVIHPIHHALIGAADVDLAAVRTVLSHPQVNAQCARFLRAEFPSATVIATTSSAEAVRLVAGGDVPEAPAVALGTRAAADVHGGAVLRENVEDETTNVTRFVWLAPAGTAPLGPADKSSVVWWGAGDQAAGWLVRCLSEFSARGVNMTKIVSRPRRLGLGHYMFFGAVDGANDGSVAEAFAALGAHAEVVKVLG